MTPPTRTRTSRVYPRECGEAPGHCQVDDEQASSAAIDALVQFSELAARGESPTAFGGRGILSGGVAPRSNMPNILPRRALPARRLAHLGATRDFHHGLLGTGRVSPDPDCLAPHQAMVHGAEQVAADAKQIQDAVRRGVTVELVRDQTARGAALALQQRPEESCGSVPMGSGRPGSLLTLAPHRSGRAGSAAAGSSTDRPVSRGRRNTSSLV